MIHIFTSSKGRFCIFQQLIANRTQFISSYFEVNKAIYAWCLYVDKESFFKTIWDTTARPIKVIKLKTNPPADDKHSIVSYRHHRTKSTNTRSCISVYKQILQHGTVFDCRPSPLPYPPLNKPNKIVVHIHFAKAEIKPSAFFSSRAPASHPHALKSKKPGGWLS